MADSSAKVDRISSLPDELLCKILSLLPIKEATVTSVLSPRWRYLFNKILDINLEFNDTSDELDPIEREKSLQKFSDFVNFGINLILHRNRAPIRKFELTIFPPSLCEPFQSQIDSLISSVLLCNVQELEIFLFEHDNNQSNLLQIFTCKKLVILKMDRRVDLDIPNSVALPHLKVLHLECFSVVGKDSLRMLIEGCPLLEELYLYIIEYPTNLSDRLSMSGIFRSKTLVSLKLSWRVGLRLPNLVFPKSVCLPYLRVLNLEDFRLVCKNSLENLIQGCPLLEELSLYGLDCSKHVSDVLYISSSSLKKLWLYCSLRDGYTIILELISLQSLVYQADGKHKICINAPNLQVLDYVGDAVAVNSTESMKHTIRAKLVVQSSFSNRIESSSLHVQAAFQLINILCSVKSLYLSDCTIEALYHSPYPLPTFKNLTNLHLEFKEYSCHIYWWKVLPRLLESIPSLEVLVLDKVFWNNLGLGNEFESLLSVAFPVSVIERLREMEIKAFVMVESNCTLVEYFLQKGKALRKMTLGALVLPSDCNPVSFRNCSEDCQIDFQQIHYWAEPELDDTDSDE